MKTLGVAVVVASALGLAAIRFPQQRDARFFALLALFEQLDRHYFEVLEAPTVKGLAAQERVAKRVVELARGIGREARGMVPRLEELHEHVARGDEPHTYRSLTKTLFADLRARVRRAPDRAPDLKRGAELYASMCAACHGLDGRGDTPAAKEQDPPPDDLLGEEVLNLLSPNEVFDALTFGVAETAMPAYSQVSERDRWDVAFYVFTLRQPSCGARDLPHLTSEELADATDARLITDYGFERLACLRRLESGPPSEVKNPRPLVGRSNGRSMAPWVTSET